ncbi:MAG: hypothetical protein QME07_07220, partial [bacterium]|nr:hypothetical protein [bacterium]
MKNRLSLIGLLILWAGVAYPLNVALTVKDEAGVERTAEPLCSGVPIPEGQLYGTNALCIERNGIPIPAQFSVLSKWEDNSIKWVLCQFQADVSAYGSSTYYLKDTGAYNPSTSLTITDGTNSIYVNTGPLQFTVNKKQFNLFDEAWIDGKKIVSSSLENGLFVTDKAGKRYTFGTPTSIK